MFLKCPRELFENTTFNPPIGYYDVKYNLNSRKVDFGEKPKNTSRVQSQLAVYVEPEIKRNTLPALQLNQQLHGYARPRDRVEFNKRHQIVREVKSQSPKLFDHPNIYSYSPESSLTIPRSKYARIAPAATTEPKKQMQAEPLQDVVMGQKLGSVHVEKSIKYDPNEENSEIYLPDQSTWMQSELMEHKEQVKQRIQQQTRFRLNDRKRFINFVDDNLEQLILRDKMTKKVNPPGPGQYNIKQEIKLVSVPQRFQCFNSQTKRFDISPPTQEIIPTPGPGDYDLSMSKLEVKKAQSFSKMLGREKARQSVDQFPVTGLYDVPSYFGQVKVNNKVQYPSAFGSGSKRF